MYAATKEFQKKLSHPTQETYLDKTDDRSILQQEISDSKRLPCCYTFKGFWIELTRNPKNCVTRPDGKSLIWEALIYSKAQSKTVISVGAYATYLEAALKAERLILSSASV